MFVFSPVPELLDSVRLCFDPHPKNRTALVLSLKAKHQGPSFKGSTLPDWYRTLENSNSSNTNKRPLFCCGSVDENQGALVDLPRT